MYKHLIYRAPYDQHGDQNDPFVRRMVEGGSPWKFMSYIGSFRWLWENQIPFMIETDLSNNHASFYIVFINDEDAVRYKLEWQ